MAFRTGPTQRQRYRSPIVKRWYWIAGGVVIAVILTVLFVPGVGENIEGRLLSWVAGMAS